MKKGFMYAMTVIMIIIMLCLSAYADAEVPVEENVDAEYHAVMEDLKELYPERYEAIEEYVHQITDELREKDKGWMNDIANWGDSHIELISVFILGASLILSVILKNKFKKETGGQLDKQLKATESANNNAVDVINRVQAELKNEKSAFNLEMQENRKLIGDVVQEVLKNMLKASDDCKEACAQAENAIRETVKADDERWARNLAAASATAEVLCAIAAELRIPQRRKDEIMCQVEDMRKAVKNDVVETVTRII